MSIDVNSVFMSIDVDLVFMSIDVELVPFLLILDIFQTVFQCSDC